MNIDPHADSPARSGYVPRGCPEELAALAAEYTLSTGCMPVFVLSQPVSMDARPALKILAGVMQSRGCILDSKIHTVSLLVLLSSGVPVEEMIRQVLAEGVAGDGLIYVEDAYRFFYDRKRALTLMDWLSAMLQHPQGRSPLVLNLPEPWDRQVIAACPNLQNNCFHLTQTPLSPSQRTMAEPELGRRQQVKQTVGQQAPRQAPDSRPSDMDSQPPEQKRTPTHQTEPFVSGSRMLWYKADPKLMEKEYAGICQYLANKRLDYTIDKTGVMARSGRFNIRVCLKFLELGECRLLMVYSNRFSRENPEGISVAIGGYPVRQILHRLRNVSSVYDEELGGQLFRPAMQREVLERYGAATAALDGMIRAMMGP